MTTDIENIALTLLKIFNEPKNCYYDNYNRITSNIIITWNKSIINNPNFHNVLIRKLKQYIKELYVVRDFDDTTTFNFRNCEVNMNYISDYDETKTHFIFTKLSYLGDIRDFN